MAEVLTSGSSVGCTHPGGKISLSSQAKLKVKGNAVLLEDDVKGKSISDCPIPKDESKGTAPDTKVLALTTGKASKLKVGGKPVLLSTLTGTTNGLPTAPGAQLKVSADQTKLTAS